jgi:hypothetical protein
VTENPTPGGIVGGSSAKHTAGLFDIRNIIAGLLGIYGVLLLLAGIFGDKETEKTGGINANLWTGLALVIVAAIFLTWARMKPTVVPKDVEPVGDDPTRPAPRRTPKS